MNIATMLLLATSILSLIFTRHTLASGCNPNEQQKNEILKFALSAKLIKPHKPAEFGVSSEWRVSKNVLHKPNICLHLLETCIVMDGLNGNKDVFCSGEGPFEVVANKEDKLMPFEEALVVPNEINVGVGSTSLSIYDDFGVACRLKSYVPHLFYAKLQGKSAIDAFKSVYTRQSYSGFSAKISAKNVRTENGVLVGEPDGKASFDPTPGRTWKVKEAKFSLSRGLTAEALDVNSLHLDTDFLATFSGSGGQVAPWSAAAIRQLQASNGTFTNITYPPTKEELALPLCRN